MIFVCICGLHAVASRQVTVQKVTTTEILHTQSDVNHELQESLSGQELCNTQHDNNYEFILFSLTIIYNTIYAFPYVTIGLSPRRERNRKLCRSPYFMNGRMTMGLGKCPEPTSKHTPKEDKSIHTYIVRMCN